MILVERTHWPLVVVGSVPEASPILAATTGPDDDRLWGGDELWVVLIVAGLGARARVAQDELVEWLYRRRGVLTTKAVRFAWVIEDDTLRGCMQAWQSLFADTLFGVNAATFGAVGPALRWLTRGRAATGWPSDSEAVPAAPAAASW